MEQLLEYIKKNKQSTSYLSYMRSSIGTEIRHLFELTGFSDFEYIGYHKTDMNPENISLFPDTAKPGDCILAAPFTEDQLMEIYNLGLAEDVRNAIYDMLNEGNDML